MSKNSQNISVAKSSWTIQPERSSLIILRLMVWFSLTVGRRFSRLVVYLIAVYFLAFAPRARRSARVFLTRVLKRPATLSDGFRHVLSFASTIHDRIYLLNDRFDLFDIEIIGLDVIEQILAVQTGAQQGAVLLGAHLGSFEVLRAAARQNPRLRLVMLMYRENAHNTNAALMAINQRVMQSMIPLGQIDTMLQTQQHLDRGYWVGMLADRSIANDKVRLCDFFGQPAPFPLGPFRMAAMLRRPVLFMTGLYLGGNRYQLHFELLADFSMLSAEDGAARRAAIAAAQDKYVQRLSHFCALAPYNWFNFFDFWQSSQYPR